MPPAPLFPRKKSNATPGKVIVALLIGGVAGSLVAWAYHSMSGLEASGDAGDRGAGVAEAGFGSYGVGVGGAVGAVGSGDRVARRFGDGTPSHEAAAVTFSSPPPPPPPPPPSEATVHTMCTSNGSPYLNFQTRIMYGTYQAMQKMPGGHVFTGFTRVLHRSKDDILSANIPTFRAQPLHPRCDEWCEFPVADRPNAVAQWLRWMRADPANAIKEDWVLMIETDYVFVRPVPPPKVGEDSVGFPFYYIAPLAPHLEGVMRKMYPAEKGPLSDIPASGPAPVMVRIEQLEVLVPEWERLTQHIEGDPESVEKLGWVREMYAFSVAAALTRVKIRIPNPPYNPLIVQPPADHKVGSAMMYHYTWGAQYKRGGKVVWEWDKRKYTAREHATRPPMLDLPPTDSELHGVTLQDGVAVDTDLNHIMTDMLTRMNEAIAKMHPLPDFP